MVHNGIQPVDPPLAENGLLCITHCKLSCFMFSDRFPLHAFLFLLLCLARTGCLSTISAITSSTSVARNPPVQVSARSGTRNEVPRARPPVLRHGPPSTSATHLPSHEKGPELVPISFRRAWAKPTAHIPTFGVPVSSFCNLKPSLLIISIPALASE